MFFYGPIGVPIEKFFRDAIEQLKSQNLKRERLVVLVNTGGGSAETVEKMVDITRFHYTDVAFIVPDYAMSAGTILCMSGNEIYMDYTSSLGPIDPQVYNGKDWVPALGYLDKVNEFIEKSRSNTLTNAEFLMLQSQDLAMLSKYEQVRALSVTLLKKWLVKYKFSKWTQHSSNINKIGQPVTAQEKEDRAEMIAGILGDNKRWHLHSRPIGINELNEVCRLKITDYSGDLGLREKIRSYNDVAVGYISRHGFTNFLHTKLHF